MGDSQNQGMGDSQNQGGVILRIGLGFDSQNRGRDDSEFRIRLP